MHYNRRFIYNIIRRNMSSKSTSRMKMPKLEDIPSDVEVVLHNKRIKLDPSIEKKEEPLWLTQYNQIKTVRETLEAPVDSMGCEVFMANDKQIPDVKSRRFHVFVACLLSSQTRDEVTHAAVHRLIDLNELTISSILQMSQPELAQVLHPVGFYNNKSKYLLKCCHIMQDKYNNDLPHTFKELVALPGIGPKMANLIMTVAWEQCEGICVDIHVHRISNRLKWVNTWTKQKNSGPEATEKALEDFVPNGMWQEFNKILVGFGQVVCTPVKPNCDLCCCQDTCKSKKLLWKEGTSSSNNKSKNSSPKKK